MGREITLLDTRHGNISIVSTSRGKLLLSQVRPFLALLFNLGHFGNFVSAST